MRTRRLGNLEIRARDDGGIVIRHHGASSEGVEIQRADVEDVIAFMQIRTCVCEQPIVDPANLLKCQLCARGIEGIDRWNYAAGRLVKQQYEARRRGLTPGYERCICGHLESTHAPAGWCGDCSKTEWECPRFVNACCVILSSSSTWCSLPFGHTGEHDPEGWSRMPDEGLGKTQGAGAKRETECTEKGAPADPPWPERVKLWSDKGMASCGYCGERFRYGSRIRSYGSGWAHVACVGERP